MRSPFSLSTATSDRYDRNAAPSTRSRVKTDSLFYRLFQTQPSLLFELIGVNIPNSPYQFHSVELKQTAFRLDGVFTPPQDTPQLPLFFVEVQFQSEINFYSRFISEIFLYLRQYQPPHPWQAVVIYPSRRIDIAQTRHYEELLNSERVRRLYIDELSAERPTSLGVSLVYLVVTPEAEAVTAARSLVAQTQVLDDPTQQQQILDLIETIIVYKLPTLSREEIQQMLGFTDIDVKQTRFYQDVFAEGRQEGEVALVLRLLTRRFGELEPSVVEQIRGLSLPEVEALAEALLEFSEIADLENWLQHH